jgi:phosphoribosyl-AMP cyclohydrolase / phosphoribosyl-ATP pyrophosphohydrolase
MTDRTLRSPVDLDRLRFDPRGLVPVVTQDARTGAVLMVAWADRDALERTLETGLMHYRSRSRGSLWKKGETSGNIQRVRTLHADCDGDTVLARVEPGGPACHTGEATCFGEGAEPVPASVVDELWSVLEARRRERPEGSYTTRLLADGNLRAKKLGEEMAELLTALARDEESVAEEAADLLYHLLVALLAAGRSWEEVAVALRARRATG